ncbi:hypothetical protein [Streptosporangium sp. KLBMP 9127]|nr:hypothetical protein [Streptosporangium sp. KLBMP 9127]
MAATPETLAEGPKETGGGHVLSRMVLIAVVVIALLALAGFEAYEITIAAG